MGPDSVGRKHVVDKKSFHESLDSTGSNRVDEQKVPRIRGNRFSLSFRSVQGEGEELGIGHPEVSVQSVLQLRRNALSRGSCIGGSSTTSESGIAPVGG